MADSISTRVLIDKKKNRVIYAEADEDFLNILFSLLTIPIGTLIRLTSTNNSPTFRIGSTNNLYKSVEDIDARCFQTEDHEAMLLISPRNGAEFQCKSLKLNVDAMPYPQSTTTAPTIAAVIGICAITILLFANVVAQSIGK
ncbi:hypothetical protein TIFTF001_043268 [Ficus carica]|uniref:Uncharacterized protein n=1 Tax=Ficus carica TaxID=3494 RepID=A0AA87YRN0_FICCA|nr:hypothetical protein TIFTF001_043268 [Ficus carica]